MTHDTESLLRLFIGLLVFRLGGEQTFTQEEINEIRQVVGGVQIYLLENETVLLRTSSPEKTEDCREKGLVI